MRRSRRLPPTTVSHLAIHHAYTSPPLPEKGGLPTIIVTPADASTISEFEIHFYSPKATQTTFPISTLHSFLPRMTQFFRPPTPMPAPQALIEKARYLDEEEEEEEEAGEDIVEAHNKANAVLRNGGYVALAQTDNAADLGTIPGVPTISEEQWTAIRSSSTTGSVVSFASAAFAATHQHNHHRFLTRKVRTLLFLSVPVALAAFHLITHQMGLFPGSEASGLWSEEPGVAPISNPSL